MSTVNWHNYQFLLWILELIRKILDARLPSWVNFLGPLRAPTIALIDYVEFIVDCLYYISYWYLWEIFNFYETSFFFEALSPADRYVSVHHVHLKRVQLFYRQYRHSGCDLGPLSGVYGLFQ